MAGPSRGVDENYREVLMVVVMAVHAAAFVLSGAVLAVFPSTRPAGFQLWLGYLLLIASWVGGGIAA